EHHPGPGHVLAAAAAPVRAEPRSRPAPVRTVPGSDARPRTGAPAGAPAYRAVLVTDELAVLVHVERELVAIALPVIADAVLWLVDLQPVAVLADTDVRRVRSGVGVGLRPHDLPTAPQIVVAAAPAIRCGRGRRRCGVGTGRRG